MPLCASMSRCVSLFTLLPLCALRWLSRCASLCLCEPLCVSLYIATSVCAPVAQPVCLFVPLRAVVCLSLPLPVVLPLYPLAAVAAAGSALEAEPTMRSHCSARFEKRSVRWLLSGTALRLPRRTSRLHTAFARRRCRARSTRMLTLQGPCRIQRYGSRWTV